MRLSSFEKVRGDKRDCEHSRDIILLGQGLKQVYKGFRKSMDLSVPKNFDCGMGVRVIGSCFVPITKKI